jgi:hypothetical protein
MIQPRETIGSRVTLAPAPGQIGTQNMHPTHNTSYADGSEAVVKAYRDAEV